MGTEDRRVLPIAFTLAIAAPIVAELFFEPRFRTADDPAMDMMARGTFLTSGTSSILLFQNSLIGILLSSLYELTQAVPWYRLFQVAVQILASTQIYRIALRTRPIGFGIGGCVTYLLAFDLPIYINPQFTITAGIAGVAGICWLQFHLLNRIQLSRLEHRCHRRSLLGRLFNSLQRVCISWCHFHARSDLVQPDFYSKKQRRLLIRLATCRCLPRVHGNSVWWLPRV